MSEISKAGIAFLEPRFVLCVGCGFVTSLLVYLSKLDAGSYTAIIIATIGAYIAGGVVERSKEIKAQADASNSEAPK